MTDSSRPVAVITGAASGIGAACAARFSAGGWRTAGIDLRPSLTDAVYLVDVTDARGIDAAVGDVVDQCGRIDALVTAAGYYEESIPVASLTREQWDHMLSVILGGTVNAFSSVLPHLLSRNTGSVVAISSELALGGSSTDLHYVAAKGAVLGLVKSLALEVASSGVRINAVAPGPTDTPLLAADSMWRRPEYLRSLPLGRLVKPEEVAATVWHVVSEGAMYCGEVLSPNAGAVI